IVMGFQPGDLSKRRNLAHFLKSTVGHPFEFDAKLLTLKSMKRALYAPDCLGHFGLAKKYYAHFTSPIRRYPDLVVHRILAVALQNRPSPYARPELEALGLSCSKTEQVADFAEKTLVEIKKYRYLEQQLARNRPVVYDATVVRVKNFGMFVELNQLQVQGLIHVSNLSKSFVQYDPKRQALLAGKITYLMSTKVKVFVIRVDFDKRQVDFALADEAGKPRAVAPSPRRGGDRHQSARQSQSGGRPPRLRGRR
ncbi:MAG: RNB domain-containing ribonuclease, partial [Lentisphaerae bacterium]|nr:RNB domain-containing ribonuclease [Lentisphaerota bacterium]